MDEDESHPLEHECPVDVQLTVETPRSVDQRQDGLLWLISWRVGTGVALRILRRERSPSSDKLHKYTGKDVVASTLDIDQVLSGTEIAVTDMECYTLGALTAAQRASLLQLAISTRTDKDSGVDEMTDRQWVESILHEGVTHGLFTKEQMNWCIAEALS